MKNEQLEKIMDFVGSYLQASGITKGEAIGIMTAIIFETFEVYEDTRDEMLANWCESVIEESIKLRGNWPIVENLATKALDVSCDTEGKIE